jgi:hypothetical protein
MGSGRRVEWVVWTALCLLLCPRVARATGDAVNVARGIAQDGLGLKGQLNLNADWTTGNTELLQLALGTVISYETPWRTLLISVSGAYAEHLRTNVAKQLGVHAQYRERIVEHLAIEFYTNYSYDKFAGFDAQIAAGPDLVLLFATGSLRVDVGLGYMVVYEEYGAITGEMAGDNDTAARAQAYVFIKYDLAAYIELIEHVFYMPRLDRPGPSDYMIISASSLSIKLNPVLSYQNSFNLSFDRPAPLNTKALNTELAVGLALRF